jgi:hypothetical protein
MIDLPPKDNNIPVLYLKQWADSDGRLVEFSRPRSGLNFFQIPLADLARLNHIKAARPALLFS